MILTVLLVSFLFFGSREKNVVEGFFDKLTAAVSESGDDDDDDDDDGDDDDDDDDVGNGIASVFSGGKNNKKSCKKYRFERKKGVLEKLEAMMYSDLPGGLVEGKPYIQGPENCVKFKELKTNVKKLLDELNKIDDH